MRILPYALMLACSGALAAPFVVEDIQVEGLQRIAASSVFNYLPVKLQQRLDLSQPQQSQSIIEALYRTGLFSDVHVQQKNNVLLIRVNEYPVIGEINLFGNKEISSKDIKEALDKAYFREGQSFNPSTLKELVRELDKQYQLRNKYGIEVNAVTRSLERGRVALDINIKEGRSARIRNIEFTGNKVYSDKVLSGVLDTTTPRWNSWFTKSDQLHPERWQDDLKRLEAFYRDRGFMDFRLNSNQVSISEDEAWMDLNINIQEGQIYRIRDYKILGDLIVPMEDLERLIAFKKGEIYNQSLLEQSIQKMRNRLADEGYALAQVEVIPNQDKLTGQTDLTFVVRPGKKVYVRKIEFVGNERTYDAVLRRELRQEEASLYSHSDMQRSLERLQRLAQIDEVRFELYPVGEDQVDVEYIIKERRTNSIKGGVGYGQSSGALFTLNYEDHSFLGTGYHLGIDFERSGSEQNYRLNFTDPYFTADGITANYRFNYSSLNYEKSKISDWAADNWEVATIFGYPLSEYQKIYLGGGLRGIKIQLGKEPAKEIKSYVDQNGKRFKEAFLNVAWSKDSLNHKYLPTQGHYNRIDGEWILPGSSNRYYRLNYQHHGFYGLGEQGYEALVLATHAHIDYGKGYGKNSDMPFYRHYYAGGMNSVRGFEHGTLGPRYENGSYSGGDFAVNGSVELIMPLRLSHRNNNLRVGTFLDFGNVYHNASAFRAKDFRYSAGVFVHWLSPLGPLNLSYGVPLNKKPGDKKESLQFTIGATF